MAKANVAGKGNQILGSEAYYRHMKQAAKFTRLGNVAKAQHHLRKLAAAKKASQ